MKPNYIFEIEIDTDVVASIEEIAIGLYILRAVKNSNELLLGMVISKTSDTECWSRILMIQPSGLLNKILWLLNRNTLETRLLFSLEPLFMFLGFKHTNLQRSIGGKWRRIKTIRNK